MGESVMPEKARELQLSRQDAEDLDLLLTSAKEYERYIALTLLAAASDGDQSLPIRNWDHPMGLVFSQSA
jgi:hypothetical protein